MTGWSIVRWFEWVVGGAGAVLVLVVVSRVGRFFARHSPRGQVIDMTEPASNVQVRTDVDGHRPSGGVSDSEKRDMAGYLLEQIRSEGLLPAPISERSPQADARVAYQEKEARFLLANAIDQLSARETTVITLQFHERLPVAELARVLAVSPSTVYRVRRSALKRLAETVRPAFETP